MRTLVVLALLLAPFPAMAQAVEIGPGGIQVYPHGGGGNCRALRAACMHKEELGESGQGNCARYRQICGGSARYDHPRHWHGYDEDNRD